MGHRTNYKTLQPNGDTPSGVAWHAVNAFTRDSSDGQSAATDVCSIIPFVRGGNGVRFLNLTASMEKGAGSLDASETIEVELYVAPNGTEVFAATGSKVTLDTSSVVRTPYEWNGTFQLDEGDLFCFRTNRTNDGGLVEELVIAYVMETDGGQCLFASLIGGSAAGTNRDMQFGSQGTSGAASLRPCCSGTLAGYSVWIRSGGIEGTWDLDARQGGDLWSNSGQTTIETDLYDEMDPGTHLGCKFENIVNDTNLGRSVYCRMDEQVAANTYFCLSVVFYPDVPGVSVHSQRIDTNFTSGTVRFTRWFEGTSTSAQTGWYAPNLGRQRGDNFAVFRFFTAHEVAMVSGDTYDVSIRENNSTDHNTLSLDFDTTTHMVRSQHDVEYGNLFDITEDDQFQFKMESPGTNTTDLGVVYNCWAVIDKDHYEAVLKNTADSGNTLKDGLVSYHRMDEASGDRDNAEGTAAYDMVTHSAGNDPGQATGIVGNAAEFDPTNTEGFQIAQDDVFNDPENGEWTWGFWIKFSDWLTTEQFIGGPTAASGSGWSWGLYAIGGRIQLRQYNKSGARADCHTTFLRKDQWYYVETGSTGGHGQNFVWLNRKSRGTQRAESYMRGNSQKFSIGTRDTGTLWLDGLMQNSGFWNKSVNHHDALKAMGGGTPLAFASWTTATEPTDDYDENPWPNPATAESELILVVDLADQSSSWWDEWDTDDVRKAQAWDGSGNRIAIDIIDSSINRTAKTGQAVVRYYGSKAASGSEKLRLYPPLAARAATQRHEAYGQFSVYSNRHQVFYPLNNREDRTAGMYHFFDVPPVSGAPGPGPEAVAGHLGGAQKVIGTGTFIHQGGDQSTQAGLRYQYSTDPVTIGAWLLVDGGNANTALVGLGGGTGEIIVGERDDAVVFSADSTFATNVMEGTDNGGAWHSYTGVIRAADDSELFKDGSTSEDTNTTDTQGAFDNAITVSLGSRHGSGQPGDGTIQWLRTYMFEPSAQRMDEEHEAIDDNSAFWGTRTWSGASGFTGAGASTTQAATAAGSGAFVLPVYDADGDGETAPATTAGVGAFVAPVFDADGDAITQAATVAGVGAFVAPVLTFTGAGVATTAAAVVAGVGAFVAPVYDADGAVQTAAATVAGVGLFLGVQYTGAGTATTANTTTAGVAAFVVPVYDGDGAVQTSAAVAAGTGIFATAIFQATGSAVTGSATASGSGIVTPIYKSDGAATTTATLAAGAGTFAPPVYSSTGAATLSPTVVFGVAAFALPVFEGTGVVVTTPALVDGQGVFAVPVFTGSGAALLGSTQTQGIGTSALPPSEIVVLAVIVVEDAEIRVHEGDSISVIEGGFVRVREIE